MVLLLFPACWEDTLKMLRTHLRLRQIKVLRFYLVYFIDCLIYENKLFKMGFKLVIFLLGVWNSFGRI